jgi:catechol 2,3-dioxygenase-like lactoylglutathione lyase family enzyme
VFDHVTIRVAGQAASARFYEIVLAALGREREPADGGAARWEEFAIVPAGDDDAVTRRLHIGFAAGSRAQVDAFWRAGVDAGYRDDGAPGPRPQYRQHVHMAFPAADRAAADAATRADVPAARSRRSPALQR